MGSEKNTKKNDTNSIMARFLHKFAFETGEISDNPMPEDLSTETNPIQNDEDVLWSVARFVIETGSVSIGLIQRKYRFGFNRAARIFDELVEEGILTPTGTGKYVAIITEDDLPRKIKEYKKRHSEEFISSQITKAPIGKPSSETGQTGHVSAERKTYHKPPIYLLKNYYNEVTDKRTQREDGEKLVTSMATFGIMVTLVDIQASSVCTVYSVVPESGTKVSKIKGIKPDLELSLGKQVEIEIGTSPGTLNLRIPNPDRGIVGIRQLVEDPSISSRKLIIPIAAGVDDKGKPLFIDITRTPHLLIAGTTGSGKSVFINDIVISVLYSCDPNEVQMILIDPKIVELSRYNSIPHLIQPVVTDSNRALAVLKGAEGIMKERYRLFAENSVKNINDYNQKRAEQKLSRILIIVDEYAELMYEAPKELEQIICSLARMSRAAGMYLILATQRPNSEVITAQIRANIPARIAFSVINWRESHTILNESGAEKLLGNGDMLYSASDSLKMVHAQAAFVSDEEIEKVLDYINTSDEDYDYYKD